MELKDYARILIKRLWLIVIGAVVICAGGLTLLKTLDVLGVYTATATISVASDPTQAAEDRNYLSLGQSFVTEYASLATRRPILQAVIDRLGLDTTVSHLEDIVAASVVEGTNYIDISVTDENPEAAARVANAIAAQLGTQAGRLRNFINVVQDAVPPTEYTTSPILFAVVFAILGVILSAGMVFVAEFLIDSVYSANEITRRTGLPVLAVIRPSASGLKRLFGGRKPAWKNVSPAMWWPLTQTSNHRLEAMNGARPQTPRILVTNPTGGRDKAVVAVNMAKAWAEAGLRVIIVDADLVDPSLEKWLGLPGQPGLAGALGESVDAAQVRGALRDTPIAGVRALTAGRKNADVTLTLARLKQVLDTLASLADVIVVVGSPVLKSSAGSILAAEADGILLALRVGQTRMGVTTDARDALNMVSDRLWGSVLSEVG